MKFTSQPMGRLLDSSYFQQMASVAYLLLLVTLITMIAIGCLFRVVAFDHVREMLLNDITNLDLENKTQEEIKTYLSRVLRDRPELAAHAVYLSSHRQVELGNARILEKLLCTATRCRIDVPQHNTGHLARGTVGISIPLGDAREFIIAYDMESMMLRIQPVPLVAGAMMLTVVILMLYLTLRAGQRNLSRLDGVLQSMQQFSAGCYDIQPPNLIDHDEIDQLNLAVIDNLRTIQRLLNEVSGLSHHIAHEMRTPLTRLQNHLSDIIEQSPTSIAPELHCLKRECESIQTLFSALLQIGEVETGRRRRQFNRVDLEELLDDMVDYYQPLAEGQGNRIELTLAGDARYLLCDRSLVMQVISNLIENAMKYAAGSGLIVVSTRAVQHQLILAVADHGPGIPDQHHDRVIERFTRLDGRNPDVSGYGLGLTLVRAVADYHQAQLQLHDNQPGLRVELRFS